MCAAKALSWTTSPERAGHASVTAAVVSEQDPVRRQRLRRLGGLVLLGVGLLVTTKVLNRTWPKEQTVVFRLPRPLAEVATRLNVSFTPVGDAAPARGLSLTLKPPSPHDLRQTVSLPDGEYIVALDLTYTDKSGPSAPEKSETSRARRVTLTGQETLVVFDVEGSE
jgi:hypothetical protein